MEDAPAQYYITDARLTYRFSSPLCQNPLREQLRGPGNPIKTLVFQMLFDIIIICLVRNKAVESQPRTPDERVQQGKRALDISGSGIWCQSHNFVLMLIGFHAKIMGRFHIYIC